MIGPVSIAPEVTAVVMRRHRSCATSSCDPPGWNRRRARRQPTAARQDGVMDRPLIGITTYHQPATWGRWHEVDATLLPAAYTAAVRAGGGTPILIPPLGLADSAAAVVSRLDGLVNSGGW